MSARPLLAPEQFVGLEGVAHLCTGGEAPWLRSHDAACRRFGALKSGGMAGRDEMFRTYGAGARRASRGCSASAPERVAFLAHASEGLNLAVAAVDWRPATTRSSPTSSTRRPIYPAARLARAGRRAARRAAPAATTSRWTTWRPRSTGGPG